MCVRERASELERERVMWKIVNLQLFFNKMAILHVHACTGSTIYSEYSSMQILADSNLATNK